MNELALPGAELLRQRVEETIDAQGQALEHLRAAEESMREAQADGEVVGQRVHRASVALNEAELAAWDAQRHAASVRDVAQAMRENDAASVDEAALAHVLGALDGAGQSVDAAVEACRPWITQTGESSGSMPSAAGAAIARAEAEVEAARAAAQGW
jgi:hypothetical protein